MLKMLLACLMMAWTPCLAQEAQPPAHDPQAEHAAMQPKAEPVEKASIPFTSLGAVEVMGRGPITLIIIPDVWYTGVSFRTFMERNEEVYTMHALTPPGYGGTPAPPPKPEGEYGAWENNAVEAVQRYIHEQGIQRALLLGHGMGGRIATMVAVQHPEVVAGVILVNTQFGWSLPNNDSATTQERVEFITNEMIPKMNRVPEQEWQRRRKLSYSRVCIDKARAAELEAMAMRTTRSVEDGYIIDFAYRDLRPLLKELRVPVLLIEANGLNDAPKNFRDHQEALGRTHAAMIPNGKMVLFRQTRHFAFDDRPEAFDRAIRLFQEGGQPEDLDPPMVPFDSIPVIDAPPPTGIEKVAAPAGAPVDVPKAPPGEPAPTPK
ncbi:MAG: alpha/beta hydrolase [Phycisphaerales bacterium]|nr:alpha/beta hydrolase [Phycisphaerales bacterium]